MLREFRPALVLVYGDTNSTLAGALASAQAGLPTGHVEAGMRSFDRTMPEELNRVIADQASDLLLCSTETALRNLGARGGPREAHLVGDVMADVSLAFRDIAEERSRALEERALEPGGYLLLTAHRAGTWTPERLGRLVELIEALPAPLVFPLHPRTRAHGSSARACSPGCGRFPTWSWRRHSATSTSEAAAPRARGADRLGRRAEGGLPARRALPDVEGSHEWVETVDCGWNTLVDLDAGAAVRALEDPPPPARPELYGGGHAGARVRDVVAAYTARL